MSNLLICYLIFMNEKFMSGGQKSDFRLQKKGSKLLAQYSDWSQFTDMGHTEEGGRAPFKKDLKLSHRYVHWYFLQTFSRSTLAIYTVIRHLGNIKHKNLLRLFIMSYEKMLGSTNIWDLPCRVELPEVSL